jgi:hypothetical protein
MSRAIHRSFLLVLFALVGSFLVATPKPALASGGVISPASGDSVTAGFTGPIQIDLSGMSPDTYTVDVYDNNGEYYESSDYTYDGSTANSTWTAGFPAMYSAGWYTVDVSSYYDYYPLISSSFYVEPPTGSIAAPADGVTKLAGSTITAKVTWANIPQGAKGQVLIHNNTSGSNNRSCVWTSPADDSTTSCTSNALTSGNYVIKTIYIAPDGYERVLSRRSMTVVKPLTINSISSSLSTFYPLIHDGYRDNARLTWNISTRATDTVRVISSSGHVVRSASLGEQSAGRHSWSWNGRTGSGAIVKTGTYRMQLTTKDALQKRTGTARVTVATGWRTLRVNKFHWGSDASSASASGACSASPDDYDGTMTLDCWGSGSASASYRFAIPSGAYNFDWSLPTSQGCCYQGSFSKSGTRTSSTSYVVKMYVDYWREAYIDSASLSYSYEKKV